VHVLRATASIAEEPHRIVVVSSEPDSTRDRRLVAELRSLGLTVVSVPPAGGSVSPEVALPALARIERAIAAVQVVRLASKEQVWIADRVTNKTVVRELLRNAQRPDQTDDSIAVGVAELLRASLMEINSESRARGEYPATHHVRELAYPAPARVPLAVSPSLWVAAAGGIQPGLRGISSAWLVRGSVAWRTGSGLGLQALVGANVSPSSVEGTAGTAQLFNQWVGVGPGLHWPARPSPWQGQMGIAIVLNRLVARGEKVFSPWIAATETAYSPGVYVHGGPAFSHGRYQLGLDLGVLVLSSPATIHLAEQRAAIWGAPAIHVTLSVARRVWP
jgi:predicted CoA-binding protein